MGAKRPGGKRPGGKRLGGETTRGGNGLGAKRPGFARIRSYNYREKTHILACVHHEGLKVIPVTHIYRSLVIRCLVVKIEHLQVTVDVVTLKMPCKPQR